jgi:hypothetical protein
MQQRHRSASVSRHPLSRCFRLGLASRERSPRQGRSCQLALLRRIWPGHPPVTWQTGKRWPTVALCLFIGSASLSAQTVQFLPEIDTHLRLNSVVRIYSEFKQDRDGGDDTQATSGPSVQLYVKPLLRLKKITTFDLDDAKPRALVLEAGYRYITAPSAPTDNRFLTAATFHFLMKGGALVTDRNRTDLDWKGGKFYWRYRNKVTLEKTLAIHSYHLIPYVSFEPYYTSQYSKWSTTTEFVGCLLPVGKHVQFNSYFEHENDTGKHPNRQTNSIGVALNLYFSVARTTKQ